MTAPDDAWISIRAVNAAVFCERLCWFEYRAGEFLHNEHTLEGAETHRRVDRPGGTLETPSGETWHTRSVWLSDGDLELTGVIDLIEADDAYENRVTPVDYKKGAPPSASLSCLR